MSQVNTADSRPKHSGMTKVVFVKVLFDFSAQSEEELSVHEGDVIQLVGEVDENWLLCEVDGREGIVPASYASVLADCAPQETRNG